MLKERIIEQAGKLFFQYGVKNVSMDDLASSVGISKRTLYENFKDKEDILQSFLIDLRERKKKIYVDMINNSPNIVEFFLRVIEFQFQDEWPTIRFHEDIQKYYPKVHKLISDNIEKNRDFLKNYLQQGIDQGYLREGLNVEVIAFLVEESTHTIIRASYLEKPSFSPRDLLFTMMINSIRGVSSHKGIEIVDRYLNEHHIK